MSNPTSILNAIETRINTLLPAYNRLKFSYDLEKNDTRTSSDAYGVVSGTASSAVGTLKTLTLDQEFGVILTKKVSGRQNDTTDRSEIKAIYDDLDTLYRDFFQSKLGITNIVYLVSELSLEEPTYIGDNVISIRMNFIVKHRVST